MFRINKQIKKCFFTYYCFKYEKISKNQLKIVKIENLI